MMIGVGGEKATYTILSPRISTCQGSPRFIFRIKFISENIQNEIKISHTLYYLGHEKSFVYSVKGKKQ